jgi:peptide/nickel transport system substrate-binding protein
MARRIRWQLLIAAISSLLVLLLMSQLALSSASVARPVAGGAYVEGVVGAPRHLNPLVSDPASDPTGADIQALVFDGLLRPGPDGLPLPALAAALPDVSDDGLTYTFTLRPNVRWHDGAPLTVDDVVFTVRAIQRQGFAGDPQAAAIWRGVLIDTDGAGRVQVVLPQPYAPFAAMATFPILPAHLLRDVPPEQWSGGAFSRQPIGTGPYRLRELTGERALLLANPAYFDGRPLIDSIELRFFPNTRTALAALGRGEIDAVAAPSIGDLQTVNLPRTIRQRAAPLDSYTVLTFNLRRAPLSDQGLRRALATGLDKDGLIARALKGGAQRIDTPLLPGTWAASAAALWYPYNQARAAELLDSLGYQPGPDGARVRDGAPLVLPLVTDDAPDRQAVAQEIARQWGELGVNVEIEQLSGAALQARLAAHDFTLALHGWQRLGPDPDLLELWGSRGAAGGRNYAGLQDDQIDELLTNAQQDADQDSRAASYAAFERRWVELAPGIILYQPLLVYAAVGQLGGLEADFAPLGSVAAPLFGREDRFRHVNRWFIRSTREIRGDLR